MIMSIDFWEKPKSVLFLLGVFAGKWAEIVRKSVSFQNGGVGSTFAS